MSFGHINNMMDAQMENDLSINNHYNFSLLLAQNISANLSVIPSPEHTPDTKYPFIVVYCILFVVAAGGNLSVVITLFRSKRHRRSRVSLMICHLAVADLMVAFIMIPLEIGWRITVSWEAGNVACKVFLFLRAFCLYLSSNVLVCVSLDRCFAVIYPLRVSAARKRGKVMLAVAWIIALVYSIPQSIIFNLKRHPVQPNFQQCVTFGSFGTPIWEKAYNLFCVIVMYFLPLMIISGAYSVIMCEISNRSKEKETKHTTSNPGIMRLRCNDTTHIDRARQRTLRLTITIVAVFIWCWTPYVVMTLWYVFDRESAMKVDNTIQDSLFIMAVSNSCMNPLVYGSYAMKCSCSCFGRNKNNANAPAKLKLQRKSTDAGIAHSDRLTAQNKDDIEIKTQTFQPNCFTKIPYLITNKSGTMTQSTRLHGARFDNKNIRETTFKRGLSPCPSIAEIVIIENQSRPSYYSDPMNNHNEYSELDLGVTRSLDTGVWR